ncbi:MAG: extracellular solute-binding protein [Saccharofermentanales bacterium]
MKLERLAAGILAFSITVNAALIPMRETAAQELVGYDEYTAGYSGQPATSNEIILTDDNISGASGISDGIIDGKPAWITAEGSVIHFTFNVPVSGSYNLWIHYYPLEGRGAKIERQIQIDGETPFKKAESIEFSRIYKDSIPYDEGFAYDAAGNEIRPSQIQSPVWSNLYANDKTGYFNSPFAFHLEKGTHILTLTGTSDALAIGELMFRSLEPAASYEDVKAEYDRKGYQEIQGDDIILIQAENALYKSDPTLFPGFDRSSPATQPFSASRILLNTIGGSRWKYPGQWISWQSAVVEPGLYRLGFRARQNIVNGQYVTRKLLINGVVPFKEAENIQFDFDNEWNVDLIGDAQEDYLFYLEKGDIITLEATLGEFSEILRSVQESIYNLNLIYRQILMITGPYPDTFRDYELDLRIPDELGLLASESARLVEIIAEIEREGGRAQGYTSVIKRVVLRIDDMLAHVNDIPRKFNDYQDSVTALGSWLLSAKEQPLELDYIVIAQSDAQTPASEAGLLQKLVSGVQMFLYSFYNDYSVIGHNKKDTQISVWIASGRDQANIIKQMTDNYFTPESDIGVNVRLVAAGSLLPAVLTGKGPDVHLSVAGSEPMNYGMRGAVRKLDDLAGFEAVAGRFYPSALIPYTYEGTVYALPETQSFPLLFYRTDILGQLGIEKIDTWDDVYNIIPELAKKNLNFGIPAFSSTQANSLDLTMYWTLLFQHGGDVYTKDSRQIDIDSQVGVAAFRQWSEFYTNYSLLHTYDFATTFRSGRTPVAIADYTYYNLLSIFAPEINGLWDIAPIPATIRADGTLDRTVFSGGTATEMMATTEKVDESWTFMKWWSEADTQVMYGKELESIMGTAARYPVSNKDALEKMPWSASQAAVIRSQWEHTQGVPEVPGGYLKDREISFALRAALNKGVEPREALTDHIFNINLEIEKMRSEFGLDH